MRDEVTVSEPETKLQDHTGSHKNWTGAEVKALRLALGWDQDEMASAVGVERPTVSNWERGKNKVSELNAAALDRLAAKQQAQQVGAALVFERGRVVGQAEAVATMLRSALAGQEVLIAALREQRPDAKSAAAIAAMDDPMPGGPLGALPVKNKKGGGA